jgi:alkylation response protein AidB-like acyl-CoA dehydrogenase
MDYQELFPIPVEWLQDVDVSMASTVSDWADGEVIAGRLEHKEDFDALLMPAMRKLFIDIGLQSVLMPEGAGGGGLDSDDGAMTLCAVLEQVGRADTGIGFLLANSYAIQSSIAIGEGRNDDFLKNAATMFCGGDPLFCALVLPYYGSAGKVTGTDFYGLPYQVEAERDGDGWVLSAAGARPQCAGANAAVFGALAQADGEPALFLVPADMQGVSAGEPFLKTGLAASVNADVTFMGVFVPGVHLAVRGEEGIRGLMSWYYVMNSAICCGALLASYEILKEWVDTRVIKGKGQVFKENPLVSSVIAEIGAKTGLARIATYNAARMVSRPDLYGAAGSPAIAATATAVFKSVARAAMEAMDNTMELMGSAGYATEWNLERYWRDIKTLESYVVPEPVAQTDMARHYFGLKTL